MRFRVTTPKNPDYNGETLGIRFTNGVALVDGPDNKETKYEVPYKDLPRLFTELSQRTHKETTPTEGTKVVTELAYIVEVLDEPLLMPKASPAASRR